MELSEEVLARSDLQVHLAGRRKSQPARPRARLWLEELESRTVPTTITRTSAPIFYTSFAPSSGPALTSHYVAYQITNTDGVNYPDVWATIGNFSGGAVTLGAHATDMINLGPLRTAKPKPRSSTCGPPFLPPMSLRLIP